MKNRIKELSLALENISSDSGEIKPLPKLPVSDPFSEIFKFINKLSKTKSWVNTIKYNFLEENSNKTEENIDDNIIENQFLHMSKLAQIGSLTAEITHEMTQPLTFLHNYLYSLSNEFNSDKILNNEKLIQNLNIATNEVYRLVNLVNHIQEFSRKDTFQSITAVKITDALENSLLLMNDQIKTLKIKLIKTIQKNIPEIQAVPNEIEQIFLNLIQNSIDSLSEIKSDPRLEISIFYKKSKNKLYIEIVDNGKGIDEDILDKIFSPFFTTKPPGKGTGLGLNIIQKIISKYGGRIKYKPVSSQGASFLISFKIK
tara:strand:- start:3775 stop:4716 length:942 start_codon:yes stop_codon:yes gene_type:complete